MMEKTGVNTFRNGGCLEPGSNSMSPLIFSPSRILQSNGDVYSFGDKFKLKPMLRARPIFYWVTFRAKSPRTCDIHTSVQRLTVNHIFFCYRNGVVSRVCQSEGFPLCAMVTEHSSEYDYTYFC